MSSVKPSGSDLTKDDRKIIRIGAFASEHTSNDSLYQLRIRFYDASSDASERMYHKETSQFGGRLLDDYKRMPIDKRGGDLCVKMSDIADDWRAIDESDENQRIEVRSIWDGSDDTDASCTIRLQRTNPIASATSVWSIVSVWQEKAHGSAVTLKPCDALRMFPRIDAPRGSLSPTQTFLRQQDELLPSNQCPYPILPLEVRQEMCVLLDVDRPMGNDWRAVAEKLGIDTATIIWIGRSKSPTSKLLDFWETQNVSGGIAALRRLCDVCEEIERLDVKELVETVILSDGIRDSGFDNCNAGC